VCPRHALAFACSGKLGFSHDIAVEIACSFPHVLICKLLWQIPCSCQGRLILILMWDAKGLSSFPFYLLAFYQSYVHLCFVCYRLLSSEVASFTCWMHTTLSHSQFFILGLAKSALP
jgi:hypothetical protein